VRVLIAEDETLIRLDLKSMLENAGLEVCARARDGLEAVELAGSTEPDVAVLDVKMPRLDGIGRIRPPAPRESDIRTPDAPNRRSDHRDAG
jgi:two-component system, response regulator PdtaR